MRRRFGRRFGKKRSVSWLEGFSGYDDSGSVAARLLTFAGPIAGTTATWGVAVQLTTQADLTLHGGEDAVVARIVGQLAFVEGRRNAGAGLAAMGFPVRLVVAQHRMLVTASSGLTFNDVFTPSRDLGKDNILWMQHRVVSPTAIGAAGAGYENMVGNFEQWVEVDIRVKRKVQEDTPLVFYMQTVLAAGTTGADCRMLGGLRCLMMRPK